MNLKKTLLCLGIYIFSMPTFGMEEKATAAWFQPKDTQTAIRFDKRQLHYSNTLQWLDNEAPTEEHNPSFIKEVSENTLATCKMIFEHLDTIPFEGDKADYLAQYFSKEIAALDSKEIRFLDIPLFAKSLGNATNEANIIISNKRKRNNSELEQRATLITSDDHDVQINKIALKKAKVFHNALNDLEHKNDFSLPITLNKISTELLVEFLNTVHDKEKEINEYCDQKSAERKAHLISKKENKLSRFTVPLDTIFYIDLDEMLNIKRMKEGEIKRKIQSMPEEQRKKYQKDIEDRFSKKILATDEYFKVHKEQTIDDLAKEFIKKNSTSFQEIIAFAELGDFTECSLLLRNALDLAHDHLIQNDINSDFSELNPSIAAQLNERAQTAIARKTFLHRNQLTEITPNETASIYVSRFNDLDFVQWGESIAVRSKITDQILPVVPRTFTVSPDSKKFVRTNTLNQSLEVIDITTKKVRTINFNELSSLSSAESNPKALSIISFTFTPDSSALEIIVSYNNIIHYYHYSLADKQLKKDKEVNTPKGTDSPRLLWQFPQGENVFIENKKITENASYLYFNDEHVKIPHKSKELLYLFTHDHRKIIIYNDVDQEFTIRDAKTGSIINTIEYKEMVHGFSCETNEKCLAVLTQKNEKNAQITLFDLNTGTTISSFDVGDQLACSSAAQKNLKRIVNFYITPCSNRIVIEQNTGYFQQNLIASVIDIETQKRIIELKDYRALSCLPDGSIMLIKKEDYVITISYELFDAPSIQLALRSCSLEESLLIERIVNSNGYVLNDAEEKMYEVLPITIKNIIKSHITKQTC